jgi:outer membrane protein assembly factor BamD (BamD/ComL family)
MKKVTILFSFLFLIFTTSIFAQKQIEQQVQRDPVLEADSKANLQVALHYFKLKKAYKGSLLRCEEIIAANPDFSRMDEVLFVAGVSSYQLSNGKGRQKLVFKTEEEKLRFAPETLRKDALEYLTQLKTNYPNSQYIGEAEKQIKALQKK